MGTRRAKLAALLSGGAIPDTADYQVRLEPEGTLVGTVNEDWAIESNGGDVFQLGNASWRVLARRSRHRAGRRRERRAAVAAVLARRSARAARASCRPRSVVCERRASEREEQAAAYPDRAVRPALPEGAATQIAEYAEAGRQALGAVPTPRRVILERFFDESGGMQLVVHAPFGSRINRAWGLALRKRFCVGFGFELQAAANEEAIILSLGPQHSFELTDVFDFLHPASAREVLIAGGARRAALRDALAVERAALAAARALAGRQEGAGAAPADAGDRPARRGLPADAGLPRDAAGRARSRCRWIIRWCGRPSRIA